MIFSIIIDFDVDKYNDVTIPENYNRYYIYEEDGGDKMSDNESETVEHVFNILTCLLEKYDMYLYYQGFEEDISDILKISSIGAYERYKGKNRLWGFWTV